MSKSPILSLDNVTHLHFIGICGASMHSLAIVFAKKGYKVSGSDIAEARERRAELARNGIVAAIGSSPDNLPASPREKTAVVYTSAVTENDAELKAAKELGIRTLERAELMGMAVNSFPFSIGVAGMHGKSTVCAMIAEIYREANADPDVLCGADISEIGGGFRIGSGKNMIYEACEYKDSFLRFTPTIAAITNIDSEHLDYFHSMEQIERSFYRFASSSEQAALNIDCPKLKELAGKLGSRAVTCSVSDISANYRAENVSQTNGRYSFDLTWRSDRLCKISLKVMGKHNLSNALLAAAAALSGGISPIYVEAALNRFQGVSRRMEYKGTLNGAVIYDDYAHHPTEIKATLAAARECGFRFISCAFQPHTYSRTAMLFCEFVKAFSDANEVIFTDIYAARETDTYGISSRDLAAVTPNGFYLPNSKTVAEHFKNIAAPGVLLLTMGAGDPHKAIDHLDITN